MNLDRKTRRLLARVEERSNSLANAIGDLVNHLANTDRSSGEFLLEGLDVSTKLASAARVLLNKPATTGEERQAEAIAARERREEKKRRRAA